MVIYCIGRLRELFLFRLRIEREYDDRLDEEARRWEVVTEKKKR